MTRSILESLVQPSITSGAVKLFDRAEVWKQSCFLPMLLAGLSGEGLGDCKQFRINRVQRL